VPRKLRTGRLEKIYFAPGHDLPKRDDPAPRYRDRPEAKKKQTDGALVARAAPD
jgi:hypothetical protein